MPIPQRDARRRGAASRALLAVLALFLAGLAALLAFVAARPSGGGAQGPGGRAALAPPAGAAQLAGTSEERAGLAAAPAAAQAPPSRSARSGVRLAGEGRLSGRVLERGSGQGVAGASVRLLILPPAAEGLMARLFGAAGLEDMALRVEPVAIARSNAGGEFAFEGVRPGRWYVDVLAERHVAEGPVRAEVLRSGAGGPVDVHVRPGGRVVGRVLRSDGEPAALADVMLVPGPEVALAVAASGELRMLETRADAAGRFAFPALAPGPGYELSAIGRGLPTCHATGVEVVAGRDTEVELRGGRGATIEGTVLSAAGVFEEDAEPVPLAGAQVGVVPRGLRDLRFARELLERTQAVSDAAGRYRIEGAPSGQVDVLARASGHVPAKGPLVRAAEGQASEARPFALARGPSARGRVTDADGRPLAGVRVRWMLADPRRSLEDLAFAPLLAQAMKDFDFPSSDADGRFVAGALPGEPPYRLDFQHPGYEGLGYEWTPESAEEARAEEIEVRLARGGAIEGIAMDAAAAEPLERFTVETRARIETEAGAPGRANPFTGGTPFEGTGGRFRLTAVRAGDARLRVTAPGYLDATVEKVTVRVGEVTRGVIVALRRGASARGRVVDAEGAPVAGARVFSERAAERGPAGGPGRDRGGRPPFGAFARYLASLGLVDGPLALSDDDGRFELAGLEPGAQRLLAVHPSFRIGASEPIAAAAGAELEEVAIVLSRGGGVHGKVLDRFDRAVEGAIVVAFSPGAGGDSFSGGLHQGRSDRAGDYRIESMEPGAYFLVLTRGNEALDPLSFLGNLNFDLVTVPDEGSVRHDLLDSSAAATRVFGIVRSAGEPLARGAVVAFALESDNLLGLDVKAARIDETGVYGFEGLAPGEYRFQIDGNGPSTSLFVDVPDAAEARIDLALPEGLLAGRVVAAEDGAPVGGASLTLRPLQEIRPGGLLGGLFASEGLVRRERADGEGRFRFTALQAGEYELRVAGPRRGQARGDFAPAPPIPIELLDDERRDDLEIALPAALRIAGRVVDEAGAPVVNAAIVVRPEDDEDLAGSGARTDAEGRFRAGGLAPGVHALTVSAEGYAPATRAGVDVPGEAGAELEIVLARGVLVRVRVLDAAGRPVRGAAARLVREGAPVDEELAGAEGLLRGLFGGEGGSDADGRIEIGRFAPGAYTLEARDGLRSAREPATVPAGAGELELTVRLGR